MTVEARSAAASADPARSPVVAAHPPGRPGQGGHASRDPREPTRTSAASVRDDPVVIDLVTRAG
ncbi:MAG TPA: hypothetical protein VG123_04065, partial [Streptosporangiaceae bacterium]|nr:hypothetical protein [Streptosporangiaceae bacterium]